MYAQVEKPKENKSRAVANSVAQKKNTVKPGFGFVNNRPEAVVQRTLQERANNSLQTKQASQLQAMADNHFTQQQKPIQKIENKNDTPASASTRAMQFMATYKESDWPPDILNHRTLNQKNLENGDILLKPYPGFGQNIGMVVKGDNVGTVHASNYGEGYHTEPGLITRSMASYGGEGNHWDNANKVIDDRNWMAEGDAQIRTDVNMNRDEPSAPIYTPFQIYSERSPCGECDSGENLGNDRYKGTDVVHYSTPYGGDSAKTIANQHIPRASSVDGSKSWSVTTYGEYNSIGLIGKKE